MSEDGEQIYKRGPTGKWIIDVWDRFNKKRIRKAYSRDKRLTLQELHRIQTEIDQGGYNLPPQNIHLSLLIRKYLENSKIKKESSFQRDRQCLDHAKKFFKDRLVTQIFRADILNYRVARLKEKASRVTVNIEFRTLKAMFNFGIGMNYLSKNPCSGIKQLNVMKNKRIRAFTSEELRKILNDNLVSENKLWRLFILVLIYTGTRLNEVLHLWWEDIDFQEKLLTVKEKPGWTPKNYQKREIPIHPKLLNALLELKFKNAKGPIFPAPKGGKHYDCSLKRRFKRLLRRQNIPNASIHTCRHTFGSRLAEKGADINTIKELMGHSSITTTAMYMHSNRSQKEHAIDALDF